jgi:hypothetical protein
MSPEGLRTAIIACLALIVVYTIVTHALWGWPY